MGAIAPWWVKASMKTGTKGVLCAIMGTSRSFWPRDGAHSSPLAVGTKPAHGSVEQVVLCLWAEPKKG